MILKKGDFSLLSCHFCHTLWGCKGLESRGLREVLKVTANENKTILGSYGDSGGGIFLGS